MARFNVGDRVVVVPSSFDSGILQKYGFKPNTVYTVSSFMDNARDLLWFGELKQSAHHSHFDSYKEEKDMNPQTTQQAPQKTKRVPFTHELWEKWKDNGGKVIYVPTGKEVMQIAYFPEADHRYRYVYLTTPGTVTSMGTCDPLDLIIPVITKRIPFNPELKTAKVFTTDGNQSVVDWAMFKDGQVACQWSNKYMGYYPTNYLEMEIEEDV